MGIMQIFLVGLLVNGISAQFCGSITSCQRSNLGSPAIHTIAGEAVMHVLLGVLNPTCQDMWEFCQEVTTGIISALVTLGAIARALHSQLRDKELIILLLWTLLAVHEAVALKNLY